jgi:hypothetical protein
MKLVFSLLVCAHASSFFRASEVEEGPFETDDENEEDQESMLLDSPRESSTISKALLYVIGALERDPDRTIDDLLYLNVDGLEAAFTAVQAALTVPLRAYWKLYALSVEGETNIDSVAEELRKEYGSGVSDSEFHERVRGWKIYCVDANLQSARNGDEPCIENWDGTWGLSLKQRSVYFKSLRFAN